MEYILKEFDSSYKDFRDKSSFLSFYYLWPDMYGNLATSNLFEDIGHGTNLLFWH